MPQPKLRVKRYTGQLSDSQHHFLRYGSVIGDHDGTWAFSPGPGQRQDLRAARDAWELHKDEITARIPPGLVAWAAREWDGARGRISHYDHLGRPDHTLADYR